MAIYEQIFLSIGHFHGKSEIGLPITEQFNIPTHAWESTQISVMTRDLGFLRIRELSHINCSLSYLFGNLKLILISPSHSHVMLTQPQF